MKTVRPTSPPADPVLSTPEALGQALRAARTQAGIRLEDAALQLGIAKQTLQNLETGSPGVGVGTALRVAHEYGVILLGVPASQRKRAIDAIQSMLEPRPAKAQVPGAERPAHVTPRSRLPR